MPAETTSMKARIKMKDPSEWENLLALMIEAKTPLHISTINLEIDFNDFGRAYGVYQWMLELLEAQPGVDTKNSKVSIDLDGKPVEQGKPEKVDALPMDALWGTEYFQVN